MVGVQIPHHFRCPVSLELMLDPVTVSTGQTYDRSSIEPWIAAGNTTCPVTRTPLLDSALIPNHTLRRLIQSWCVANRRSGVECIPTPKQPADPSRVRALLSQAASTSSAAAAAAAPGSLPPSVIDSLQAPPPDSSSSSSKMIVKVVAATVASHGQHLLDLKLGALVSVRVSSSALSYLTANEAQRSLHPAARRPSLI